MKKEKLSAEHVTHLENLIEGGLMRKVTPPEIAEYFVKHDYAQNVAGGLMATGVGYKALHKHRKESV